MKNIVSALSNCPLFSDMEPEDVSALLGCLSAQERQYDKNEYVFQQGDEIRSVGIVLSGGVNVFQEDFWGNRMILAHIESGALFAESFTCAGAESLPVGVVASERSSVLLIDYRKILTVCPSNCDFHAGLIRNMVSVLAQKNILFMKKIEYVTHRTIRKKLLAYLSSQAMEAKSASFSIPFDRQEMADYLAVDRSALSAELSRLRGEGVLTYEKNRFTLTRL